MQFITDLWECIVSNKKWLFSGIGAVAVISILKIAKHILSSMFDKIKPEFITYTLFFTTKEPPFFNYVKKEENPIGVVLEIQIDIKNKTNIERSVINYNLIIKNNKNTIIPKSICSSNTNELLLKPSEIKRISLRPYFTVSEIMPIHKNNKIYLVFDSNGKKKKVSLTKITYYNYENSKLQLF